MKILIVEDHLLLREVVRQVCTNECGYTVVGETTHGGIAIKLAAKLRPELVILDLGLPDLDGFEVAAAISKELPSTRFLVLTASIDARTIHRFGKSGLHGFLDKGTIEIPHLSAALVALASGKTYFSSTYHEARLAQRSNPSSFEKVLSECEQELLSLIGAGLSDEEIGTRLGISPTTSQTHRRNILQKLQIKGTPKLAAFAVSHGFTRFPTGLPFLS